MIIIFLISILAYCSDETFVEIKEPSMLISISDNENTYQYSDYSTNNDILSITNKRPIFTWSTTKGAKEYILTIGNINGNTEKTYTIAKSEIEAISMSFTIPENEDLPYSMIDSEGNIIPYYWMIKTKNEFQYMPSNQKWNFIIRDSTPPNVEITSPIDGIFLSEDYQVNIVTSDNHEIKSVYIQIDDGEYQAIECTENTCIVEQIIAELSPGIHTYRAKAVDLFGNEAESNTVTIYINPNAPTLDIVDSCTSKSEINFSSVNGASYYEIEIYDNENYTGTPIIYIKQSTEDYKIETDLTNGTYYYRIRTVTKDDEQLFYSNWSSSNFVIAVIDLTTNIIPDKLSICYGETANLTWNTNAQYTYDVYYDTDNEINTDGAILVESVNAPNNTLSSAPKPVSGIYYWKIISKNAYCSSKVAVSADLFIVIDAIPASNIVVTNICSTDNPSLSFTTTAGHSYDIYLDTDNSSSLSSATTIQTGYTNSSYTHSTTISENTYYWKIMSKNGSCVSNAVISNPFTVTNITNASSLIASGDVCEGATVNLSFTTTAGLSYDIYYDTDFTIDTTATMVLAETITAPNNSLSSPISLGTGNYCWKVLSKIGTCTGSVSEVANFEVFSIPPKPSIDNSPNGVICTSYPYTVNIDWTSDVNTEYLVEYRKNAGSWQASPNSWLIAGSASDSFNLSMDGTYDFRLVARNKDNNTCLSNYSDIPTSLELAAKPSKPILNALAASTCTNTFPYSITLNWTFTANTEYLVEYRKDAGSWQASPNSWLSAGSASDTFNIETNPADYGGVYEFRLTGRNENTSSCQSDISDIISTTIILKPEKITFAATPVNDDPDTDGDVVYNWTALTNTNASKYELYMDTNADPVTLYTSINPSSTTTSFDAATNGKTSLTNGTYYWKIRAIRTVNSIDCIGNFSDIDDFTVASACAPPSSKPTQIDPINNALLIHENRQFKWSTIADADSYTIEVATTSDFASVNRIMGTPVSGITNTYWNPPTQTLNNPPSLITGDYYWRVKADKSCGSSSSWSNDTGFKVHVKSYDCDHITFSGYLNGSDTVRDTIGIGLDLRSGARYAYLTNNPSDYNYGGSGSCYSGPTLSNTSYVYKYNMNASLSYVSKIGHHGSSDPDFTGIYRWGDDYDASTNPTGLRYLDTYYMWTANMTDVGVDTLGNIYVLFSVTNNIDGDFYYYNASNFTTFGTVHQKIVKYDSNGNFLANLDFGTPNGNRRRYDCPSHSLLGTYSTIWHYDSQAGWYAGVMGGICIDNNDMYISQYDQFNHDIICSGTYAYSLDAVKLNISGGTFTQTYSNPYSGVWSGSRWGIDYDNANDLLVMGLWKITSPTVKTIGFYKKSAGNYIKSIPSGTAPSGYTYNSQAGVHLTSTNAGNYLVSTDPASFKVIIWRYWMNGSDVEFELLNPIIDDSHPACYYLWPGHVEIDDINSGSSIENYDIYIANRDGRVLRFDSVE